MLQLADNNKNEVGGEVITHRYTMNIVYCQMFFFLLTSDSLNSDSVKKATC